MLKSRCRRVPPRERSFVAFLVLSGAIFGSGVWTGCSDALPAAVDQGPPPCTSAADCSDGVFCNGMERCMPLDISANARGCVAAETRACALQMCDEVERRCVSDCEAGTVDLDGDGHVAVDCGGDDCDDSDATRFPGNAEVCDSVAHDEDCDPSSFGALDVDGDGFVALACCNEQASREFLCGLDCDDLDAGANPDVPEVCDGRDNDCDGEIDEGVRTTWYRDLDGDGFGSLTAIEGDLLPLEVQACAQPGGYSGTATDCDDARGDINRSQQERCTDEESVDDDCDSRVDEGLRVDCFADADEDGYAASGAALMSVCRDPRRPDFAQCPRLFTHVNPALQADCDDADPTRSPGRVEVCTSDVRYAIDEDCSGSVLPAERDDDGDGYNECPGFFQDCDDLDVRAHPGQQAWFTASDGPRVGVGGWDFDCNGTSTPLLTGMGSCTLLGGCVLSDGWVNAMPACGQSGDWLGNCTAAIGLCVTSAPVRREQQCR